MKWLHPILKPSTSSGFTLTELLVAVAITSVMMSLAGFGIVATLRANERVETEISRRANLNRALDFVSDEIRMAKAIAPPANASIPTQACGTTTGVLDLTMPDNSHTIYYVHNLTGCTSSLWSKPAVLRRVSGGSDNVLVDALTLPSTLPSCGTGTTSAGGNGFYACISNNRSATLYLYGNLNTSSLRASTSPYPVSSQVSARSF